jgi:branched-subunit amino acid aminotransferase/4-amino-4-deoxychorismate lyase
LHSAPVSFSCLNPCCWKMVNTFCDRHLQRLRNSAEYFGFVVREEEIRTRCQKLTRWGSFKVRLVLWKDGRIETRFHGSKARIRLTRHPRRKPIDSSDRFSVSQDHAEGVVFR